MRFVWLIAALLLLTAATTALWPSTKAPPTAAAPPAPVAPAPSPAPNASVAAPAPTAALDSLLGGSLTPSANGTGAATNTPTLTVGASAKITRIDDHTIRLDDRFTLRGAGTEGDPYLVSWELLGSAHESIDAATARFVLPGRIADLRGAWVQLSGYWAAPLRVFETKDLMVMLNKWDGCCIGLPPTPFDSIEATLAAPVAVQGQHLFRYGTIKGRLEIEPFVAGSFLLGLYRLQDAVLETS